MESDFFRNRLSHSLEVAQIAKSIANKLNYSLDANHQINTDLVEFAGLAHDLGHPPFGHTGEKILNSLMKRYGGFEGNAQTFRILTRLEKRLDNPSQLDPNTSVPRWFEGGVEVSVGLNLCSRTLASVLKYDAEINYVEKGDGKFLKGYYRSESPVVRRIKRDVVGDENFQELSTIECQIMDYADDIAYSTYDLEDAFKGGALTPLDLLTVVDSTLEEVARRVSKDLKTTFSPAEAKRVLRDLFGFLAPLELPKFKSKAKWKEWYLQTLESAHRASREYSSRSFFRTSFTSALVGNFINAIQVEVDHGRPALSKISMEEGVWKQMSVLKQLSYVLLIESSRFKIVSYRGEKIIQTIFEALSSNEGYRLMPADFVEKYRQAQSSGQEDLVKRVICDFIAGMTDDYAIEFYSRLQSEQFQSIFNPSL